MLPGLAAPTGALPEPRMPRSHTRAQPEPPDLERNVAEFFDGWRAARDPGADLRVERTLGSADPRLYAVIQRVASEGGPLRFRPSNAASHFDALARSVVYQQLSKSAAATIYARYVHALGGVPSAEEVARATPYRLRRAGLSAPKVRYLQALAAAVVSGQIELEQLAQLSDDAVIAELTCLPGIGIWTAQMFLMFRLHRPDVLPLHDAGVQRGLQLAHGLNRTPAPRDVERAGLRWTPHRSIASLYLWAAVETT